MITFHSTKVVQTGPKTFACVGDFMIPGVTKSEKPTFTLSGKGTGSGKIKGTMALPQREASRWISFGIQAVAIGVTVPPGAKVCEILLRCNYSDQRKKHYRQF